MTLAGVLSLQDLGISSDQAQGNAQDQARLDKRSHMLKMHQRFGLIAARSLGRHGRCFRSRRRRQKHQHDRPRYDMAVWARRRRDMYFMSAYYAIRAPRVPGTATRGQIRLHKALAWIHGPGMILTPILGAMAFDQKSKGEKVHGIAKRACGGGHRDRRGVRAGHFVRVDQVLEQDFMNEISSNACWPFCFCASASLLRRTANGFSEQSTLTYHVSHPLHQIDGVSHAARGKGVCHAGQCDFLIAVPVKSFDSGDSNRDLHMLQVTRGAQFPYGHACAPDCRKRHPHRQRSMPIWRSSLPARPRSTSRLHSSVVTQGNQIRISRNHSGHALRFQDRPAVAPGDPRQERNAGASGNDLASHVGRA